MYLNFFSKKAIPFAEILFLALIWFACTRSYNKVEVMLNIPQWSDMWVKYTIYDRTDVPLDSVLLSSKGIGKIAVTTTEPQVIALSVNRREYPLLMVVKPGETITLTLNNGLQSDGSLETERVLKFQQKLSQSSKLLSDLQQRIDAIDTLNSSLKDSLSNVYLHLKDSIRNAVRNEAALLVGSNPFDLSSAFIVNAQFESEQLLPYSTYSQLFRKVDSCLTLLYPNKKLVLDFRKTIAYHKFTDSISRIENALMPGMVIPTAQYETYNAKSFTIPGIWAKWTLLYFWDKQSLQYGMDMPKLKQLYARYKPAGFEIVSFGVNADSLTLANMAKSDTLSWLQVLLSDLFSKARLQHYGIVRTPANLLIDKSGKVLLKNVALEAIDRRLDSLSRINRLKPLNMPRKDNALPSNTIQ